MGDFWNTIFDEGCYACYKKSANLLAIKLVIVITGLSGGGAEFMLLKLTSTGADSIPPLSRY